MDKKTDPWSRLLTHCRGAFTEPDLALLYWDTVRDVCKHFAITSPMDLAAVELRWKKMQRGMPQAPRAPPVATHEDPCREDSPTTPPDVMSPASPKQPRGRPQRESIPIRTASPVLRRSAEEKPPPKDLEAVFEGFCLFGRGLPDEMDCSRTVKFCRDNGLLCTILQSQDVEILFAKFRRKKDRKMHYEEFRLGFIPAIATRLHVSVSDVVRLCLNSRGPRLMATRPEHVPLHDDKQSYTGVHAHGGPTTNDYSMTDFRNVVDRRGSDVRGVTKRTASPRTPRT